MSAVLIHGDQISCSRIGGAMRRESSLLRHHAQALEDAAGRGPSRAEPGAEAARSAVDASLRAIRAVADHLDDAGAALQRYATDLAEAHELGRRADLRVQGAELLLDGSRVIEPWGPAITREAEQRRAMVPGVQARVDLATTQIGRARGRLLREMNRLVEALAGPSPAAGSARPAPTRAR